jgi:hypothetical protein
MKKKYEEYEKMFEEEENEDTKKEIHGKMKEYAYICTSCKLSTFRNTNRRCESFLDVILCFS